MPGDLATCECGEVSLMKSLAKENLALPFEVKCPILVVGGYAPRQLTKVSDTLPVKGMTQLVYVVTPFSTGWLGYASADSFNAGPDDDINRYIPYRICGEDGNE